MKPYISFKNLKRREEILKLHGEKKSFAFIGKIYKISRQRVEQIIKHEPRIEPVEN